MEIRNYSKIIIIFFIFSAILTVFSHIYLNRYHPLNDDQEQQFYEMKTHYENKTFPALGARLVGGGDINDKTIAQVPGGFYYIYGLIFFQMAGENLYKAMFYNLVFSLFIFSVFIFWIYKRFGILSALIALVFAGINGYFIDATSSFYNPNITLMLSFLFLIMFGEYVSNKNAFAPALMLFPILALMGQSHLAVYYGGVPTLLVYLIIKMKHTKKYILPLAIGVFISFLFYLPYLVYEMQNSFSNIQNALTLSASKKGIPFPQISALFIFPTLDLSGFNIKNIFSYWGALSIPVAITVIISYLFVFSAVIFSLVKMFKSKFFEKNIDENMSPIVKESIIFFFLYIPITIIATIVFKGVSGPQRYHYALFAFSFIPLIYFTNYIFSKNGKLAFLYIFFAFLCMHELAVYSHFNARIKNSFEFSQNQKNIYNTLRIVSRDADKKPFAIEAEDDVIYAAKVYMPKDKWNVDANANTLYKIVKNDKEYEGENEILIYTNKIYRIYKNIK